MIFFGFRLRDLTQPGRWRAQRNWNTGRPTWRFLPPKHPRAQAPRGRALRAHNPPKLSPGMDKQRELRLRTFKGGSIIFGLAAVIDSTIRNMSETGASLEVTSPLGIPDRFTLLIKPEVVKRNCRVAWRSAKRIGVQFV